MAGQPFQRGAGVNVRARLAQWLFIAAGVQSQADVDGIATPVGDRSQSNGKSAVAEFFFSVEVHYIEAAVARLLSLYLNTFPCGEERRAVAEELKRHWRDTALAP